MGVYIKGMEMPKCCPSCPFNHETYWLSRHICVANKSKEIHVNLNTGFPDDCPLVEVKPHGRLVDANAVMREFELRNRTNGKVLMDYLLDAPTVIEAEDGR